MLLFFKASFLSTKITNRSCLPVSVFACLSPWVPLFYDVTALVGLAACSVGELHLTGQKHFDAIMNTSFVGASGRLKLDPATGSRRYNHSMFALHSHVPVFLENGNISITTRKVADYENGDWNVVGAFLFNDNTTIIPLDLPNLNVEDNTVGPSLHSIGLTFSLLVILASLASVLWTYSNRTSRVIRASQPLFLYLICFGT